MNLSVQTLVPSDGHYHGPFCQKTIIRLTDFERHLGSCQGPSAEVTPLVSALFTEVTPLVASSSTEVTPLVSASSTEVTPLVSAPSTYVLLNSLPRAVLNQLPSTGFNMMLEHSYHISIGR